MNFYHCNLPGRSGPGHSSGAGSPPAKSKRKTRRSKQLIRISLAVILLMVSLLPVHAFGFARKITLSERNVPLEKVFAQIKAQSGYTFVYTSQMLQGTSPVSVTVSNATLQETLDACFKGQPLTYTIHHQTIIVQRKEPPVPARESGLLQQVPIKGKVVDENDSPLPGVTVQIKGTTVGTTTGINGEFTLQATGKTTNLIVSFIGYETQEVAVTENQARQGIQIKLAPSDKQLEEVVVVAFGEQKKTEVVGSVTTIKPSELKVPSSNLTTALAGRAAGVIAYQRSGEPGQDNADFFIRGVTTFGYKKDPLILIDGVELTTTDLARLQPDDIAAFSIMKDATSTALYGARGANGVILVTTKQGKEGKAKISLRLENSLSSATRNVAFADPVTYMELHNEAILTRNPLGALAYPQQKIDHTKAGTNPYMFPATDWREKLFRDYALNQRLNMNLSGGGKVAKYYVAGSFNNDNGVLKVDPHNNFNNNIDLKSYNLRSNVNVNVTKTTEMIVRLNGNFDDYTGPLDGGTALYKKVMRTNPVRFPAYYPADENYGYVKHTLFGNSPEGTFINPYADMVKGYKDYSRALMLAQLEFKQDLSPWVKGLAVRTLMNTSRRSYFEISRAYNPFYYAAGSYDRVSNSYLLSPLNEDTGTEYLDYSEGERQVVATFYLETAANYNRTFGKHGISGMLVNIRRENIATGGGSLQASLPSRNLGLSGRATYAFDNRYFAEFNFGYNGSERFHESQRFGFFPSAGLAWSISEEEFMKPLSHLVHNLRLRGTYGFVGNDAIGSPTDRFFYLSEVNMNNAARGYTFGVEGEYSRSGISISRYSNANITWESSRKANVALELGLLNHLNVIAEYFTEKRENILMPRVNIPEITGLSAVTLANVGKASGQGVDLSLDYSKFFANDFWVQSRANFTYATSKWVKNEEPDYEKEKYLSKIGYPLGQTWGFIAEHLFVDEQEVANSPIQNFGGNVPTMAGDIKYRDVNGDGQITDLDKVPIGYPTTPEIVYGFGASAGFRNFDVSAFFQGAARESFWIGINETAPFVNQQQLLKAYADDHWSEEHRNIYALWPRLSESASINNQQVSTWFMRDGTFLRLKSVELGYTLPRQLTGKVHSDKIRLYASGTNLFTWSQFRLWDVEMAGNGLGYPIQKVINFGINLSF